MNKVRKHLFKFPPDLSLGYKPGTHRQYRAIYSVLTSIKNIIPLYVLDKFTQDVWSNDYSRLSETIPDLLKIIPFVPLLLLVFPLTAGVAKIERNWEELCSEDYTGKSELYHTELPYSDDAYDRHNNKQDVLNKLLFYPSYMITILSFTIIGVQKLIPSIIGILGFFIHGYHSGFWNDLNARIRAKTIIESNKD